MTTQACVHSTLREAVDRGYWCLTLADCCAALDPGSARFVDAYLERLTNGVRNALENALSDGDIGKEADLDDLAAFLAMSVVGISALLRANATPQQMHAASRGVVSFLEAA